MRIHLFDPGYILPGGHHVEWGLLVGKELMRRGHEVNLFCHATVSENAKQAFSAFGTVTPVFSSSPYTAPRSQANEQPFFVETSHAVAESLGKSGPADLWLWPTLFAPQLLGCALASTGIPIAGCIHFEPSYMLPNGKNWWRQAIEKALETRLSLNLCATTPSLQRVYSRIAPEITIRNAPIAHNGLPASAPKKQMKKIGFFGYQRKEKGSKLLQSLIDMLLSAGYEVVLHDSRKGREHKGKDNPYLSRIGYVENFAEEIARCDLVVIPYDPVQYHFKLSGVVAEALASGVPVIVPAGTTLMKLVLDTGAGRFYSNFTAKSIFHSVCEAKDHYARLAESAFKTSLAWPSTHGSANFVDTLLGKAIKQSAVAD